MYIPVTYSWNIPLEDGDQKKTFSYFSCNQLFEFFSLFLEQFSQNSNIWDDLS